MRFDTKVIAVVLTLLAVDPGLAFNPNGVSFQGKQQLAVTSRPSSSAVVITRMSTEVDEDIDTKNDNKKSQMKGLTKDLVSKLRFREVQKELELRDLDTSGTFTSMRTRLRQLATDGEEHDYDKRKEIRVIGADALNNVSETNFFLLCHICFSLLLRNRRTTSHQNRFIRNKIDTVKMKNAPYVAFSSYIIFFPRDILCRRLKKVEFLFRMTPIRILISTSR